MILDTQDKIQNGQQTIFIFTVKIPSRHHCPIELIMDPQRKKNHNEVYIFQKCVTLLKCKKLG